MTSGPDLNAVFDRAVSAFQSGDLAAASEAGALLLDHAPSHPAALNLMGLVKLRQGDAEDASALFQRAASAAPNDSSIHRNLGHAFKQSNRPIDAVAAYETATSLAPRDPGALYDLANALARANLPNRARDTYRRVLRIKPDHVPSALALARLLEGADQGAAALDVLEQAVAAAPGNLDILLALAHLLRRAGRVRESIKTCRAAVEAHPENGDAHAALGFALGEGGDLEEAVSEYRRAIEHDSENAGVWSNLGWTLVELNRHAEALEPCERAVALAPELPAAHYHLALARRGLGRLEDAAAALESALAIDRRHVRAVSLLGAVREELGDTDAARRIFDADRLIARTEVTDADGFESVAAFNEALSRTVSDHPSNMWNRPGRSTVSGSQTLDIARDPSPAMATFRAMADDAVRRYLADRTRDAKPGSFFHDPPARWELVIWGVQLRAGGHQIAHNHPSGIVSGVYYPQLPASIGAGANLEDGFIEFRSSSGRDDDADMAARRMRTVICPEEGHLLLFPSYFWHRTIPFEGTQQRISVAFDAIPKA